MFWLLKARHEQGQNLQRWIGGVFGQGAGKRGWFWFGVLFFGTTAHDNLTTTNQDDYEDKDISTAEAEFELTLAFIRIERRKHGRKTGGTRKLEKKQGSDSKIRRRITLAMVLLANQ